MRTSTRFYLPCCRQSNLDVVQLIYAGWTRQPSFDAAEGAKTKCVITLTGVLKYVFQRAAALRTCPSSAFARLTLAVVYARGSLIDSLGIFHCCATPGCYLIETTTGPNLSFRSKSASKTKVISRQQLMARDTIVIIGTGWAGFNVSQKLDDKKFDIVVVSPEDTSPYTPLLVRRHRSISFNKS
jgi:hypothetical protein